ncbi:reverse transcriptase-like protein [Lapidilactobacillus bayanensis]|uniref:reverse transcriptase-like protein n=1 Tax=Lapidilactobacillus bayanensis TaxID=2485998 RepID=UPI000F7A43B1|nr:reverse transcriptase-like protein [Lapidilactobacillus bayanensis]
MLWLATDASVDDAKQLTGIGIHLYNSEKTIDEQLGLALPYQDNHHAEFQAVLQGVQLIAARYAQQAATVVLQTDSKIVKDSLEKRYAKHYGLETAAILAVTDQFPLFLVKMVNDNANRAAHQLARQAIYQR